MRPDDAFQVDYLEEAIRKFSEARVTGDFESVRLKSPVRPRKVRYIYHSQWPRFLTKITVGKRPDPLYRQGMDGG